MNNTTQSPAPAATGAGDSGRAELDTFNVTIREGDWEGTYAEWQARHGLAAQPAPGVGGDWRDCYSRIIKALGSMVTVSTPDKLFDLDAIPRDPIMEQVVRIRQAVDSYGKTLLSARPAESVDEEMTHLMEIHQVSDLPALVRMLLRFNENLRSRQRPDPQIPQRAPREG